MSCRRVYLEGELKMKNTVRKAYVVLFACMLCVCLLAGCGPVYSGVQSVTTTGSNTTTTQDTTTIVGDTTVSGSENLTVSQTTTNATTSVNPSQCATTTTTTTTITSTTGTPAPTVSAKISDILIGGVSLYQFSVDTKSYTYYLDAGTTVAPQVTATKTDGVGDITITQASSVTGTATVSLNGVTYSIQFKVRRSEVDILNNTYYRLKTEKKLNVAYLGGSVTDGFGSSKRENSWRCLTTTWLKSQFPAATITETNAGIGGTGSVYGAHRAIQDLKLTSATEKPDLIFIEFAFNDGSDKTVDTYMESIVKTIYQYAPQADIVMVYITGFDGKDNDFNGKVLHQKIADAYGIPSVDVGARLWKDIVKENGGVEPANTANTVWSKYFMDIVHPTDAGYAKYAQYVKEFLSRIFSQKTAVPSGLVKSYVPAKTVTTIPVAPYVDNFKGLVPTDPGVLVDEKNGYIAMTKVGSSFEFKFTGTDLKFWIYGSSALPSNGELRVQVDDSVDYISFKATNHQLIPIASGLANKEHTVKVKLTTDSVITKAYLDLRYFLISGDTQMRGITLVK